MSESPFDEKVNALATVLDDHPPGLVLKAIEALADDPDARLHSGDVATIAGNVASREEMERAMQSEADDE